MTKAQGQISPPADPGVQWYEERHAHFEKTLNGERNAGFHALRRDGLDAFRKLGFPTSRNEEWRFTNVAPIAKVRFDPVAGDSPAVAEEFVLRHALDGAARLVVVNGHVVRSLSDTSRLPKGVMVTSLREAMREHADLVKPALATLVPGSENAFTALSAAFLLDGAFVFIPNGTSVDQPIQILVIAADERRPLLHQPRHLVVLGEGSRATIGEQYVSVDASQYLTNAVTEIHLGARAVLEHDRLQIEHDGAFHVGTMAVRQGEGSEFTSNAVNLGGAIVRNTVSVVLAGRHAVCTLNGLSLGTGTQLIDNHTAIDHAMPECSSHELYKAILDGRSRGVFNGKIFVRKDAQKTDAKQTNKTLLLSDDATIDTKPQLEIFADDVKCTHGATVGQLAEEQIFYLRSRGIGRMEAEDMLTYAFAGDVIDRVHIGAFRDRMEQLIHARLDGGRTRGAS